jgi:hypothetical protein
LDSRVCSFRGGLRGGLGGRAAQRPGAHHDALAVTGEHEHLAVLAVVLAVVLAGGGLAAAVEGVEVDDAGLGELLDLAFAQLLAGAAVDRGHRVVERAAGGLDRGEAAQPVGVFLDRQVEQCVGGMQVRVSGGAVGQPGDLDLTEDRGQSPAVSGLDPGPRHPGGVDDIGEVEAGFPHRAQVQVVLQQLAQQRAALDVELVLELGVRQLGGLGAVEEAQHGVEPRAAGGEPVGCHAVAMSRRAHRGPRPALSAVISAARPASPRASSLACAAR